MDKYEQVANALKNSKNPKSDSDEIRKFKSIIYHNCHSNPRQMCIGRECPLHDVMELCEKRHRLGEF